MMKKQSLLVLILALFLLSSCHDIYSYRQDHPELNSIAVESIIGSISSEMNRVLVLDEDPNGRILFAFAGYSYFDSGLDNPTIISILIAQKTTSNFAYYYDTKNYMSITVESVTHDLSIEKLATYFSEADYEALKQANDWNKPIDESRLFQVQVSRRKSCDVKVQDLRKYEQLFNVELNYNYIECYAADRNGLMLVSITSEVLDQKTGEYKIYLLLLNDDHKLKSTDAFMETPIQVDLQALFEFKQSQGWSFN